MFTKTVNIQTELDGFLFNKAVEIGINSESLIIPEEPHDSSHK